MAPTTEKSSTLLLLLVVLGAGVPLARQAASAPSAALANARGEGEGRGISPQKPDAKPNDPMPAALLRSLNQTEGLVGTATAPTLADFGRMFPRQIDTIVATVPNPRVGHLAIYFDQAIDALMSAAAAEGYLRDRHWFPWHSAEASGKPASPEQALSAEVPEPAAAAGDRAEPGPVPGFIVFRRQDGPGLRLLVVFLVGESPVSGLSTQAFAEALEAGVVLGVPGPPRVLGPFFSGSARALGQALRAFRPHQNPQPIVVTGSATASSVKDALAGTVFSRRVVTDQELFQFVTNRVTAESGLAPSIALLAETDTLFGATFPVQGGAAPIHRFAFPLHVAELRAAHSAGDEPEPKKQNLSHSLELKLDDKSGDSQDLTPAFSNLTTFEVEIGIRQTLAAISRLGVQYLLIVATDVTDLIFLAREAHQYCPGVQLVTLEADQLLTHPDLLRDLSGMLVASTYPLFLENQRRVDGRGTPLALDRKLFSSEVAEGVYNAALDLLNRFEPHPGEVGSHAEPLDDTTLDGATRGNQMWLSRVSNGRFWPVATEPARADPPPRPDTASAAGEAPHLSTTGALAPVRPTYYADAVVLLLLFGAIFYLFYLWLGRSRSPGHDFKARYRAWSASPYILSKGQYLATSLLAPATLGLVILVPARAMGQGNPGGLRFALTLLGGLTELVLLLTGAIIFVSTARSRWYPRRQKLDHRYVPAIVVAIATICLVALGARYAGFMACLDRTPLTLLLLRVGDPFGVCPLAPLFYIATGFFLWAVLGLRRVRGIEQFPDEPPLPQCQDIATPRLADLMVRMHRGPKDARDWIFRIKIVIVGLFVVPACFFFGHLLPTFEGRWFDALFKAAFLALYGTVLLTFVHFIVQTRLLRLFLRRMAALPMIEAYDRVAHKVSGTFGFQLHARVPEVADLDVARTSATALAGLAERFAADGAAQGVMAYIAKNHDDLKAAATDIDQAFEGNATQDDDTRTKAVHTAFFAASRTAFRILDRIWRMRAETLDLSRLSAVSPADSVVLGGTQSKVPTIAILGVAGEEPSLFWSRLAEDFVAMRVATFVIHVLGQVRALMLFGLSAAMLLVASVVAYPFHPGRFITVFTWVLVIVVTVGCFLIILRLEKDEIMSRLGGTEPGRINLRPELISKLVIYVALPLVGLLTAVFPEVSDLLSSWIDPLRNLLP